MANNNVLKNIEIRASEVDRNLREFSASARLFSAEPNLINKYENRWVCVYKGQVAAVADSLEALSSEVEAKAIPFQETVIRHLDREEKTLIL